GLTDTDDALDEVREGRPVAVIFPDGDRERAPRLGTLFIPNSLMVIRGGPNPDGAKKLIDYLLSADVERRLAEGPSGQLPLNPEVKVALPRGLEGAKGARPMRVDFERAADLWDQAQAYLARWR